MAQRSKEYWVKRAEQSENRSYAKGEALAKKLKREYTKAAKEIRQKLDAFYGRYASEQGLSYAEAVKRLNSAEAREWRRTLGEYVDEINVLPDGKAKDKLIAELDARSYASQQDRLSSLAGQIDMEVDRLFASGEQQMTMTMIDVMEDGYQRKVFDLQQRAGVIEPFARLSTEMIENALTYPWSGADFSSRLWENKRALIFNMRQTITQGLIQGQSVPVMAKGLADSLGKSYVAAERLIRTETSHFHNVADINAYEAAGVAQYEYMASLDERTCPICGAMDGKHFDVEEAQAGVNYAPMHPNCRCTTIEYDPEDAADWAASGKPMPENMTYAEWIEEQEELNRNIARKENNAGAFSNLKIPMQKRYVHRVADKYGVDLSGITVKIQRSEALLALTTAGSTDYNNIGRIDLFPNAFIDEEQLTRTLIHEKRHVWQLKTYGKTYVQDNLSEMERDAYSFEDEQWEILRKRVTE